LAAAYGTWREYCCGDPDSNDYNGIPYGGNLVPLAGDRILVSAWYCDENGEFNIAGGYGCTHLHDLTAGWVFSCTLPSGTEGGKECWSVKAMPECPPGVTVNQQEKLGCMIFGNSAEFILENQPPTGTEGFPRFMPFRMVGIALTSAGPITWVDIDPTVFLLTDYTRGPPRITVTLPGNANTAFRAGPKRARKPR
jgi:hypothetical protein